MRVECDSRASTAWHESDGICVARLVIVGGRLCCITPVGAIASRYRPSTAISTAWKDTGAATPRHRAYGWTDLLPSGDTHIRQKAEESRSLGRMMVQPNVAEAGLGATGEHGGWLRQGLNEQGGHLLQGHQAGRRASRHRRKLFQWDAGLRMEHGGDGARAENAL